jgi:serine phosphatase RsbU (regulator of sigma subunit)
MLTTPARAASCPWRSGEDTLLLFTDGISDARSRLGARLGEERVLETVRANRTERPAVVVEHVFDMLELYTGDTPRHDDLTLVIART